MRIARPESGFKIDLAPGVKAMVESRSDDQGFCLHWDDVCERLRFTAHVEGVLVERFGKGYRLWSLAAQPDIAAPAIRLVYLVLGDRVTVKVMSIG